MIRSYGLIFWVGCILLCGGCRSADAGADPETKKGKKNQFEVEIRLEHLHGKPVHGEVFYFDSAGDFKRESFTQDRPVVRLPDDVTVIAIRPDCPKCAYTVHEVAPQEPRIVLKVVPSEAREIHGELRGPDNALIDGYVVCKISKSRVAPLSDSVRDAWKDFYQAMRPVMITKSLLVLRSYHKLHPTFFFFQVPVDATVELEVVYEDQVQSEILKPYDPTKDGVRKIDGLEIPNQFLSVILRSAKNK